MRYQPHLKRIGPKHLILNNFPRYIKQDLSSRHVFAFCIWKSEKAKIKISENKNAKKRKNKKKAFWTQTEWKKLETWTIVIFLGSRTALISLTLGPKELQFFTSPKSLIVNIFQKELNDWLEIGSHVWILPLPKRHFDNLDGKWNLSSSEKLWRFSSEF